MLTNPLFEIKKTSKHMALIFNGAASSGGHSGLQHCVWREMVLVQYALEEEQLHTNEAIRAWTLKKPHIRLVRRDACKHGEAASDNITFVNASLVSLNTTAERRAAFWSVLQVTTHYSFNHFNITISFFDPLHKCFELRWELEELYAS